MNEMQDKMFQFTHPVWGATPTNHNQHNYDTVSIHAPRVGCDNPDDDVNLRSCSFQFTHPVWGAT